MIRQEDIANLDPFKDINFDGNINLRACIGDNCGIVPENRDIEIIDGYRTAAKLIYDGVLKQNKCQDTCVYPLFFVCRHSLELSLKVIIRLLLDIYKIQNEIENDDSFCSLVKERLGKHSIEDLVDSLKKLGNINSDIKKEFDKLEDFESYTKDYYFDSESDASRYTFKKDGQKNFEGKMLLDISILYEKNDKILNQFEYFHYLCSNIARDYMTGTFTKKLSRNQLREISKKININDLDTFDEKKRQICNEYELSSNDFSKAINAIKKNREFSLNIGIEIKFGDMNEEDIKQLVSLKKLRMKTNEEIKKKIPNDIKSYSYKSLGERSELTKKNRKRIY